MMIFDSFWSTQVATFHRLHLKDLETLSTFHRTRLCQCVSKSDLQNYAQAVCAPRRRFGHSSYRCGSEKTSPVSAATKCSSEDQVFPSNVPGSHLSATIPPMAFQSLDAVPDIHLAALRLCMFFLGGSRGLSFPSS